MVINFLILKQKKMNYIYIYEMSFAPPPVAVAPPPVALVLFSPRLFSRGELIENYGWK